GVGPETMVGLAIPRSVELLVAMYAIVKAGGAYLPIDPDHPAERNEYVLDSARPPFVLTTAAAAGRLPAAAKCVIVEDLELGAFDPAPISDRERSAALRPDNTAYVIYTSGSTGRPKGVAVPHAAICNQLRWKQHAYPLSEADAV